MQIASAPILLKDEKRRLLLTQIRAALEENFDNLCLNLIHNTTNYCQLLPETLNSYYSGQGGLLDYILNRTEAALALFQMHIGQSANENKVVLSAEQKLWQYALFSASILQAIGKLQSDFYVEVYDSNNKYFTEWIPVLNNMSAIGHCYSYAFKATCDVTFRNWNTLLLVHILMPIKGFAWIASSPEVFMVWLALLNEDQQKAGVLGDILTRAKAIALQRYFNKLLSLKGNTGQARFGRVRTFEGNKSISILEMEQMIGIEFLQWITQTLSDKVIMLNKAPLFMVPGGMLISVDMFKSFMKDHPEFKNWQAIQKGLLSLGLHRVGPNGDVIYSQLQTADKQQIKGIILSQFAMVLPDKINIYNAQKNNILTMSATEFIHQMQFNANFAKSQTTNNLNPLPVLNTSGQWEVIAGPEIVMNADIGGTK